MPGETPSRASARRRRRVEWTRTKRVGWALPLAWVLLVLALFLWLVLRPVGLEPPLERSAPGPVVPPAPSKGGGSVGALPSR